jgi:hypothetical protein
MIDLQTYVSQTQNEDSPCQLLANITGAIVSWHRTDPGVGSPKEATTPGRVVDHRQRCQVDYTLVKPVFPGPWLT